MIWEEAPDIKARVVEIVSRGQFSHVQTSFLYCFRSRGSVARAYARIWSLPTIWQKALNLSPAYCLEVISERFDRLSIEEQTKVLIHELMHVPKTFSGALLSHRHPYRKINNRTVNQLFEQLFRNRY